MTSTLKKLVSRLNPMAPSPKEDIIKVAAFGKHPGWDDHIDDIGLTTEALVTFKRRLYLEGICGNIDSGRWLKFTQANQAIEFGHTFVNIIEKTVIIGRLWASTDGKCRSSYPMVICVQCSMFGLDWMLEHLPACLEGIEKACRETKSAEDVVEIIAKAKNELLAKAQNTPITEDFRKSLIVDLEPLPNIANLLEFQTEYGLIRILYFLEREVDRFQITTGGIATMQSGWSPKMLRIPYVLEMDQRRLKLWISYLILKYGLSIPMCFLIPDRHPWMDVILGHPTPVQFYCLRASDEAIPLTSRIPYNIEPEYVKNYISMMKRKS